MYTRLRMGRRPRTLLGTALLATLVVSGVVETAYALPKISAPFTVDQPVPVQSDKWANDLRVATDGDNIFTVFEDGGSIRGMLVNAEGSPLLAGMPFYATSTSTWGNYDPTLAFGGGNYLLAWSVIGDQSGIWAQLIDAKGAALGDPIQISEAGYYPAVAKLGDRFAIFWVELGDNGTQLQLATIDSGGTVTPGAPLVADGKVTEPSVAAGPNGVLVAWATNQDSMNIGVDALLLGNDGAVSVPQFALTTQGSPSTPKVVSDGNGYLVAWSGYDATTAVVEAVPVDADGTASAPLRVVEAESLGPISLGAGADGYVITWKDYSPVDSDAWGYRPVSASGQLGVAGALTDYPTDRNTEPALLGVGAGFWIAYQGEGVFGAFTDTVLSPVETPVPLSLVANSQDGASVHWNERHYVVSWGDERGGPDLTSGRVARVNRAGRVLDATSLVLTSPDAAGNSPVAASMGSGSSLFAWTSADWSSANFRALTDGGIFSSITEIDIPQTQGGPSLASNGGEYAAIHYGAAPGELWLSNFTPLGGVSLEPQLLAVPDGTLGASLLGRSQGFLVVLNYSDHTELASLHADGTLGTPVLLGSGLFPVETAVGDGKTVVVWSGPGNSRLGRFWGTDDWEGEEFTLSNDGTWGSTVWDGDRFAAVWQRQDYHAEWTTFDDKGVVAPAEELFPGEECNGPKLASDGEGQYLLSCVRYDRDYSRRLVNYLIGEPHPDTDPMASAAPMPTDYCGSTSPSGCDTAPPTSAAPPDAPTSSPAAADAGDSPSPGTSSSAEPSVSTPSEMNGADASDPSTQSAAKPVQETQSGCQVGTVGVGASAPSTVGWLGALALAFSAAGLRRRRLPSA